MRNVGSQVHYSFPAVVMFLKVLLNQYGLDKVFEGGLGSFRMYVLVAFHVSEECCALGV